MSVHTYIHLHLHAYETANAAGPRRRWVEGDATALPFGDCEFDAATMGYGLRNVNDRPKALRELHRVLRPGASVAILDFNNSSDPTIDSAQAWFLERLVVPAARAYDVAEEYEYLRPSIKSFPQGTFTVPKYNCQAHTRILLYPSHKCVSSTCL